MQIPNCNILYLTCFFNHQITHVHSGMSSEKLNPQQHQVKAQFSFHMTYMVNHCLRLWLEEMAEAVYTMETKNQCIVSQHPWNVSDSQHKERDQSCLMKVGRVTWGNLIVFLFTTFTMWFLLTMILNVSESKYWMSQETNNTDIQINHYLRTTHEAICQIPSQTENHDVLFPQRWKKQITLTLTTFTFAFKHL